MKRIQPMLKSITSIRKFPSRYKTQNQYTTFNHKIDQEAYASIFNMFKFIASMLFLMNGFAAMSLLNRDPNLFFYPIMSFSTGCLLPCVGYIFSYFVQCDSQFKDPRVKRISILYKYRMYSSSNIVIIISFASAMFCFYVGLHMSSNII